MTPDQACDALLRLYRRHPSLLRLHTPVQERQAIELFGEADRLGEYHTAKRGEQRRG